MQERKGKLALGSQERMGTQEASRKWHKKARRLRRSKYTLRSFLMIASFNRKPPRWGDDQVMLEDTGGSKD